jgi:hypothetical protein
MMSNTLPTKEEKKNTKWKFLSFLTIGILMTATAVLAFQVPQQIMQVQQVNAPPIVQKAYGAGVLANVFALPADNLFSTKTYYTIAFTTATTGSINVIEMMFPAGFNVASAKLLEVQGIGAGSLSVSGQTVTYTISSAVSVPAQRAIKISIADITNSAITSNQVAVTTKALSGPNIVIVDGPTNSAIFTLIQVSNPMITNGAVSNTKIGANAIDTTKIIDGQVTVADMAANSVDASKITDGSIGKADVSTTFVKKVTVLPRTYGGAYGWITDTTRQTFIIPDSQVTTTSLVVISLGGQGERESGTCAVSSVDSGSFTVHCDFFPPELGGALPYLNYVVIN